MLKHPGTWPTRCQTRMSKENLSFLPGVIYAIRDPRTNAIRYIGKTTKRASHRWKNHLRELRRNEHGNIHLQRWFNKIKAEPTFSVLQECLPNMLNACEEEWIAHGRAKGWKLCNIHKGGDESSAKEPSVRAKLSEAGKARWKDPEYVARWRAAMAKVGRGRISDEERARREAERERNLAIHARNMQIAVERRARKEELNRLVPITCNGNVMLPCGYNASGKQSHPDPAERAFQWFAISPALHVEAVKYRWHMKRGHNGKLVPRASIGGKKTLLTSLAIRMGLATDVRHQKGRWEPPAYTSIHCQRKHQLRRSLNLIDAALVYQPHRPHARNDNVQRWLNSVQRRDVCVVNCCQSMT